MSNFKRFYNIQQRINKILEKDIFFIIGTMKSGTTWLQKALDGHPDICCNGESHLFNLLAPNISKLLTNHNKIIRAKNNMLYQKDIGYPYFINIHGKYLFISAICMLFDAQMGDKEYKIIGEKTPDNIRHLSLISSIFPNAKFVHIIRDGRDGAISGWYHIYRDTPDWAKKTHPKLINYVETYAKIWAKGAQLALSFAKKHPERCFETKYEEFHENKDIIIKDILKFLGAETSPDTIKKCLEAGSFKRLSKGRTIGEEDKKSHFRKGIVGDWKNHFDDECIATFEKHAGHMLKKLGYDT
jgi:hypothetical protein